MEEGESLRFGNLHRVNSRFVNRAGLVVMRLSFVDIVSSIWGGCQPPVNTLRQGSDLSGSLVTFQNTLCVKASSWSGFCEIKGIVPRALPHCIHGRSGLPPHSEYATSWHDVNMM